MQFKFGLVSGMIALQASALEINWKAVSDSKKVNAGVTSEHVLERDHIRVNQTITSRRTPLFNHNDLRLEGARLRAVDEKTGQLIDQIQKLIRREKQRARIGELKMRLAELYYDRARTISLKESEGWSKAVEKWNALPATQRASTPRPVLKTPEANNFRRKSLGLYTELERSSADKDNGRSQMIDRSEVLFYLAMTYSDLGEKNKAIQYFEELTKRFPSSEKAGLAKLSLADAYFDGNQFKKALPLYLDVANNSAPQFAKLRAYSSYRAAWCYSNTQEFKKAVIAFIKTVELSKAEKSDQNLSFVREAYSDLASAFAFAGQYNDGWTYFRETVRNKELLEKYELTAAQVAKDRGHYKIAEFFYNKLLSSSPTASFARDLAIDRAENAKKSGNLELYAEKIGDLLRDYGAGSPWLKAQKIDPTSSKALVDELVSLLRRDTKNFHQAAQKRSIKSQLDRVKPLYRAYFAYIPLKDPDTNDNVNEMRYYFADLLYETGDFVASAEEYSKVGEGKYAALAAFNRILCYREAGKKDKQYGEMLVTATNDFVAKYPNDKRAGDLMYASANQAFESGAKDQSLATLRTIVARFSSTSRGVDAAERIMFLDEKNENFDALVSDADAFAANSALMATGGEDFKKTVADVKQKALFKRIEKMPEDNKAQQSAKAAAFLAMSSQVPTDLKEKALQNAITFYNRAGDKPGSERAQAELVRYFPKSQYAKNVYLGQADSLLEKADFETAIRQYTKVLGDYKGSAAEREKILGNLFFVKAHLEDVVVPELKPDHSMHADTIKLGRDYLKEFRSGSNNDFIVTVLAYRNGATVNDLPELQRTPSLSGKTKTLLSEAEVVLKVRSRNSSSYPGLLHRYPPKAGYSEPVKQAMGMLAYQDIEPKYRAYSGMRVSMSPKRLAATLSAKVKSLEQIEKNYRSVVGYGDATYSLKALERLADLYKGLSNELGRVTDPEAKKELEKFATSFSEKSKSFIELCLGKARELKLRGQGLAACRAKATWSKGIMAISSRTIPDLQWIPKFSHKRPLTEFAERSFKQGKLGAFLLAQDLLERSADKPTADEKFYMDFLGAVFDWRASRGAAAEATLLDLSSRADGQNKRTVVKNLASLYLQVGDYKQASAILAGVDEDSDVRGLRELAQVGGDETQIKTAPEPKVLAPDAKEEPKPEPKDSGAGDDNGKAEEE